MSEVFTSERAIKGVKNIIAVASGKGGVGKSTIAVNLALALKQQGFSVGLLDADIYGPSQPMMLGATEKPTAHDAKTFEPVMCYGIQSMSIGYLIDTNTPMVWRGPMVSGALQQLLQQTHWNNVDYLVVDLPPGTGDIQITLAQKIPVTGAVIVTTPQDIALLDARRAVGLFEKVNIPVLGVIENMAVHQCTQCGHSEHIFGEGGGSRIAKEFAIELLGSLPLAKKIQEHADSGKPTVVAEPDGDITGQMLIIAEKMVRAVTKLNKKTSFPKIVIET